MNKLHKSLSLFGGTIFFLNLVIGAGLLVLPGLVYQHIGNLALVAWGICALSVFPLLMIFVILGKHFPNAGGIAHYCLMAFGKTGQRCASLLFLGAVIVGMPSIALTGGYYVHAILKGNTHIYAAFLLGFAGLLHFTGGKRVGRILETIGTALIGVIILLLIIGCISLYMYMPASYAQTPLRLTAHFSVSTVFAPYMMIFFAFTGWEIGSTAAEEFNNPERDFPRAMILSYIIASLFYIVIAWLVQKFQVHENLHAPFIEITRPFLGIYGNISVAIVAVILIFANLFGAIWAISRLLYALGRDGILPSFFSIMHNSIPQNAIGFTCLSGLFIIFIDHFYNIGIATMLGLAGQNLLLLYGLAAAALVKLTHTPLIKLLAGSVSCFILVLLMISGKGTYYPIILLVLALTPAMVNKFFV